MTTGWTIRFRGRLSPDEDCSTSQLVSELLDSVGLEPDAPLPEHYGVEPLFGGDMIFAGVPFGSVYGLTVVGATLEFGACGTNLTWPHLDEEDEGYRADYRRMDAVLDFLSDYTVSDDGEVHGVVGFEFRGTPDCKPRVGEYLGRFQLERPLDLQRIFHVERTTRGQQLLERFPHRVLSPASSVTSSHT